MDLLKLECYHEPELHDEIRYKIYVNNMNFIDLVRQVELPLAAREGHPEIAGGYIGFNDWTLVNYFNSYISDGKMYLLACDGCGDEGCWGLFTRITATDSTITWSNFYNNHRNDPQRGDCFWDHSALGTFVFEKEQYVEEFARECKNLNLPPVDGLRLHPVYSKQ